MSNIENGGPAFPVSTRPMETEPGFGHQDGNRTWQYGGMTLRDYFAAKALPIVATGHHCFGQSFPHPDYYASAALDAYKLADAMLRAREAT